MSDIFKLPPGERFARTMAALALFIFGLMIASACAGFIARVVWGFILAGWKLAGFVAWF